MKVTLKLLNELTISIILEALIEPKTRRPA